MTDKENYLTHEKIVIIDQLYSFGFTKADIAAKFGVTNLNRISRIVSKNKLKQGFGFMADMPDELKKSKRDGKMFLSLIIRNKEPCTAFCSRKCAECNPDVCGLKTTKEFFFERLIYLMRKSDYSKISAKICYYEKLKQRQEIKNPVGRPKQTKEILKPDFKVELTTRYQDLPAWQVRELDAKTAEHNRQVGFNPKIASRNTQTHDYSRLYDSF